MFLVVVLACLCPINAFQRFPLRRSIRLFAQENEGMKSESKKVSVLLGPNNTPTDFNIRPIFEKSTIFVKKYRLPFNLNIEKPPQGFPAPVVNKDSAAPDGERVGDVLRATTAWAQNFNNGGAFNDITSFAGSIKWRNCVFDTTFAPWDDIIKALVSNNGKSDEVTLVFERPLEEENVSSTTNSSSL